MRASLAAPRDGEGESRPNCDGTDDGQGPAGYRAALEMPFESKEAGKGASRTDKPLAAATGDNPKPSREGSSSRGEPYCELVCEYVVSMVGRPFSGLGW